ncbi:MAG: stage III sporulation protein AG [Eubacteriales bacterium]|nr:stage III sporulation protein AG [Eubacteriales bacterium]MDY5014768.1 stage III sporulation protein AG [Eubacteriales bacterium]
MENRQFRAWMQNLWHKYKYVLLVAAAGAVLLLWPFGTSSAPSSAAQEPEDEGSCVTELEEKLEARLSKAEGVGRVAVVLSVLSEPERILAADSDTSDRHSVSDGAEDTESDSRLTHVILSDGSGGERPVILREDGAVYRGAVVICEGGDLASVRLTVTRAVSALTGLSADRIVVMKMG